LTRFRCRLSAPSFKDVSSLLEAGATETLDIYRALMPVVHVKEVDDVPALAMQFANDCEELAVRARDLKARQPTWNSKSAEERLLTLSKSVQEKQIVSTFPMMTGVAADALSDTRLPKRRHSLKL
jgi:hypothetical protein